MNDLKTQLQNTLELTTTEADIYLAALPYPSISINDLVKLTSIKRTTIYHAVDTLVYKGLASKKLSQSKSLFTMIQPQFLQHGLSAQIKKIEDKQNDLQKLLPELKLLQKDPIFSTQVQHFQGVSGVKAVYEEFLYCKSRRLYTITPRESFLDQYGKNFHDYVSAKKRERGIHTLALWEDIKLNKRKNTENSSGPRDVRIMPKSMQGKFRSKIVLFDKRVALITPSDDPGAIIINSPEVHAIFLAMFDVIWDISKKVKI